MANTVELVFGADQVRTTNQVITDLQKIAKNVEASGATKLKFSIDTNSTNAASKQINVLGNAINSVSQTRIAGVEASFSKLNKTIASMGDSVGSITGLESAFSKLSVAKATFDKSPTSANLDAYNAQKTAINSLISTEKKHRQEIHSTESDLLQYRKVLAQVESQYNRYSDNIQKNTELNANYQTVISKLKSGIKTGKFDFKDVTDARTQVAQLDNRLTETGGKIETFTQKLKNLFGIHLTTALTMVGVHLLTQSIRKVFSNVVELDTEFTQFKIVTQSTDAQLVKFGNDAAKVAEQIGSSISDIVNASTVFARLGYSASQSLDLSKFTTIYSKVADVDLSAAESNITSIVKAFNLSTDQLESTLDKLTYVGNNFPIAASELGEGMQNAASALSAGGNSFEQSLAILTAANTTLQDISKSSTAVRTITARVRNSSVELEDLGESLDSSYNTVVKYREQLKAISGVDILQSDNQTFKSTYDILDELQKKWGGLNDTAKASITTMLAGTRQSNAFLSIMGNWNEATNVMDTMSDSTGALQKAQETYIDSIQGRVGQFKATFQELSTTLIDSDIFKGFISGGTELVSVLNNIINFGDGAIVKIGLLIAAVKVLDALSVGKILPLFKVISGLNLQKFLASIQNLNSNGFTGLFTSIPKLIAGINAIGVAEFATTVKTEGLAAALKLVNVNPVILGLSALITAIGIGVVAYNHFNVSLEEHKKALDDAKSEYSSTTSEIESLNNQLKTTQDRLDELSGHGSLTVTEQGEYDKLVKTNDELQRQLQLKEAIAANEQKKAEQEAIGALNSNGYYDSKFGLTTYGNEDFWGSVGSKVDAITAAKNYGNVIETLDQQISDLNQKYDNGKISEEEYLKQSKALDSDRITAMASYGNVIQDIQSEIESLNGDTAEEKSILSSANVVIDEYTSLTGTAADATSDFGESVSDVVDLSSQLETTTSQLLLYSDTLDSLFSNGKINDKFKSLFGDDDTEDEIKQQIAETFSGASDSVQSGILDIIQKVQDGTYDYKDAMTQFSLVGAKEVQGIGDQLAASITSSAFGDLNGLDGMIDSWKELSIVLKETADSVDLVKKAQDELNSTGSISIATALDLIEKNSDYADILKVDTSGGITLVDNAEQVLIGTKINAIKVSAQQQVNDAQAAVTSLELAERFKDSAQEIQNKVIPVYSSFAGAGAYLGTVLKNVFSGNFSVKSVLNDAKSAMDEAISSAQSKIVDVSGDSDALASAKEKLEDAKKLKSIADNLNIDDFTEKYTGSSGSSSKDSTELYIADIDKLADAERRLKNVQNELSQQEIFGDLADSYAENIANIQKEISLYKQEQIAIKELNAERTKQIQENVSNLQAQGFSVAYNASSNRLAITNMEHINQIVGKTTEETNNLRKAAESLIDTTQTLNDDNIKGTQDWYSSLKSIKSEYEELQSVVSSTVEKAFSKVSDLLNDEKEAYEKQKSNLESVASTVTSYINDYISGLQEQNDELDKQISLQEKLEALDKAKTQRNKRIFKSGEGFVWSADESAVNSAQEEYDSAKREYDLDARIQELQDYADAWKKATDAYQTAIDENLAATILGTNWRSDILGMNYESIYNFQEEYDGVLSELDESIYGSVAYQIKNLEKLQKEWDDSVDAANSAGLDYQSVLDLINTYESGSYETRLGALSSFVSSAISQYQSLAAAAASAISTAEEAAAASAISTKEVSYNSSVDYAQKILDSGSLSEVEAYAAQREAKITGENKTGVDSTQSFIDTWKAQHGYASGGVVDYTGPAMVHGATAAEMMLNNADVAKVYDYIHSGNVLAQSAANLLVSSNLSTGSSITPNSDQNITFNMGDVNVSGVQDVNGVADEIVKKLPMAVLQKIYSKKKRR